MAIALSLRQPWLELVLQGRKKIEVRSWSTKYRGTLLLHASKIIDVDACEYYGFNPQNFIGGYILGSVELIDCLPFTRESWESLRSSHLNLRDFKQGLVAWCLINPLRLKPEKCSGRLGLFNVPDNASSFGLVPKPLEASM